MRLAVIGGGIAGTAAAWIARQKGLEVTAFIDRPGASSLYAGALDLSPWEDPVEDEPLESEVLAFAVAMDAWSVGTESARVATYDGVLRPARGRDSSLLDIGRLAGRKIAVASTRVDGWDAARLARSLSSSPWAARTATRFEAVNVEGVVDGAEGRAGAYDIAALHDAPNRVLRLAEQVKRATTAIDGWLFGPWLGTTPGGGDALSALVGKPCGETTSPPSGPAGARFDASRDALLASSGAEVRRARIESVERRGDRLVVESAASASGADVFDAVVLAIGGLIAGGVVLGGGARTRAEQAFVTSVRAGVEVGFGDEPLERASADDGVDLSTLGMDVLERIGILHIESRARGAPAGLYVAGDCASDLPRTALAAARSGILAGRRAAEK